MKKIIIILLVIFGCTIRIDAQTLSEAEVVAKMNEAFELDKAKKKAEALDAFLIVGKNTELQRTEAERQTYVCSQTMACMCYESLKRYEEAYLLAKKLMSGRLSDTEKKDVYYLYAMNGYMYGVKFIHRDVGQFAKGRAILEELVPYADGRLKDYILPKIPLSWFFEGAEYELAQNFCDALRCYEFALKGYHELGKTKDELSMLQHVAYAKKSLYDFDGSVSAYKQALSMAKTRGDVGVQKKVLWKLRELENSIGNVKQAQAYAASIDSLSEVTSDLQVKYEYYNQKGSEARQNGQYGIAEQWYLRGKEIAEKGVTKAVSADKHQSYVNLQNMYAATGRYDEALLYARKAINMYQAYTPKNDATYNMPYMALADIYRLKGDKENCYSSLVMLFNGLANIKNPKDLYALYTTRGRCRFAFEDYQAALTDYKKADELLAVKYPQTDADRISLLALMGGVEHQLGNYAESERNYRDYAEYVKGLYGENDMNYVKAQIYLANAEGFAAHMDNGCENYVLAGQRLKALMKKRIPYMSITEREGFWDPLSSLFTMMTPYALEAKQYQTPFTKSCYDALVMSKAFLLDSERSMFDVIKRTGTPKDMQDYTILSGMKNRIKGWENDYQTYADSILRVSKQVSRLENQLASRCLGYSDGTDFMDVDYASVKQALKQNEVLIDFTDFVSKSQGRKYAAYIINKEQDYPLLKPLFAEKQIESLGIIRPDMYYNEDYVQDVLSLLWEPLKGNVSEGATIYYVPSQLLFQVSLESLPLADGSLLGSHYNFIRLSSARELLKIKAKQKVNAAHTAVLYGGLQYDLEASAMAAEAKKYELPDWLVLRGDMARGDSVFRDLQGSRDEIAKIESILKRCKWQVTPYTGKNGTEESFLAMHGKSPRVLHLATHGFYYTPGKAERVNYLKGYTDAMSLSGLVLSGGNAAWQGKELPEGVLGGILTANDIARMDLSDTDMVVLSACKSGQGKATSEGLYGLQRAFKKAGVGTIVMSLWNVDDKVTSEFMVAFYERLTDKANVLNKRKAFEEAKEIIRKKHSDPYYWAAFVMLD